MESVIDTDAPLDYVEFQLFPNQDRYKACACTGDVTETIASGHLGQLVLHMPKLKDLYSKGSGANYQIQRPKDLDSSQWFTKATVTRFLHIVGSMDILNTTTTIQNEIAQLEEAKKFHLSLYNKDESKTAPTDASKNELLRAMELRLTTLKTELATAFNRAAGTSCFPKHIYNMEKLSQHIGDMNLRNTLLKFVDLSPMDQNLLISSTNDSAKTQAKKPSGLDTPVKYGVSPAKAAQIERQYSSESEKSSDSEHDEQQSVERSRSFTRSASPRRSASPMRRIQIGRSGSRRAPALTIKSLNIFPARDKTQSYRDAYSSEEEGSEKLPKKSDSNAMRISVKDAISLFENKQKDHPSDAQKKGSTLEASFAAKRSVLRRWSAGVGDPESVSECSSQVNSESVELETPVSGVETKTDTEIIHGDSKTVEDAKIDDILHSIEERMSKPIESEPDILVIHHEEDTEKLTASAEWNRQKEAELNEMLTKMIQSKPSRNSKIITSKKVAQDDKREQRGGFYNEYKGKRDEKLRGETMEKRAEKDAQFRAMQQVLEQRKAAMASASMAAVTRSKSSISKPQKVLKSLTPSTNPKKEPVKPTLTKKVPSKTSPSPGRKSFPSVQSPGNSTRISPAKTPCGTSSAGTTPTRRKPQKNPGPTGPQTSPKGEKTLQRLKPKLVKATQTDTTKSTKGTLEKKQQPLSKNTKISKTKAQAIPEKGTSKDVAKPSFYNKVTKKGSVVPLESKPFLRKGSVVGPSTSPVAKTKVSSIPKKLVQSEKSITVGEYEPVADTFNLVSQQIPDGDVKSEDTCAEIDSKAHLITQQECSEIRDQQVNAYCDDNLKQRSDFDLKGEVDEDSTISPTAWVEVEENEGLCLPPDDTTCEISSRVNEEFVTAESTRVRHSLSQMLLEESAEVDNSECWGNAEIPASIVYQKDAPKGFKRLLKFARKSKGDQNSTGWSSPSVFSEGEDDTEESKAFGKKNIDSSLRKSSLHASNHGHQKTLLGEGHGKDLVDPQRSYAQSNSNNFSSQSSSKRLQEHISGTATSSKATRSSFFSLSALRGNKLN